MSLYADRVFSGVTAWVWRIMRNSEVDCSCPSMVHEALKILCRQCSEFACANIISSTSDGSRPSAA